MFLNRFQLYIYILKNGYLNNQEFIIYMYLLIYENIFLILFNKIDKLINLNKKMLIKTKKTKKYIKRLLFYTYFY